MATEENKDESSKKVSNAKKAAIWAFGIIATAIAGFASERVQESLCIKLPTSDKLEYAQEGSGAVKYSRLESSATRKSYDGKNVSFRAIYLGENVKSIYSGFFSDKFIKNKIFINTRDPSLPGDTNSPFQGIYPISGLPIIISEEIAASLADVKPGQMIEFEGVGRVLSINSDNFASVGLVEVPSIVEFFVQASSAKVLHAINDPADRFLCRLLHERELRKV